MAKFFRQTKEQRRIKFKFARMCGATTTQAREIREWSNPHMTRYILDNVFKYRDGNGYLHKKSYNKAIEKTEVLINQANMYMQKGPILEPCCNHNVDQFYKYVIVGLKNIKMYESSEVGNETNNIQGS